MKALASAVNECGDRKFQLAEYDILLRNRERVRLYKSKAELCDIFVLYAVSIERIETNPGTDFGFPVADCSANVIGMLFKRCDKLPQLCGHTRPCSAAIYPRHPATHHW